MAMGLPTIVYDSPVHREYLIDLGIYVSSGSIKELTEQIEQTLVEIGGQDALGRKLQQRAAQNYSWTKAGERIVQLYRSLVNDGT